MTSNQAIIAMFNLNTSIHMVRIVPLGSRQRRWSYIRHSLLFSTLNIFEWILFEYDMYTITQIHCALVRGYFFVMMQLPFVFFCGCDLEFMEVWIHIVCLVAMLLVSTIMDLWCVGGKPCLDSFYTKHGYAYLGDDIDIYFLVISFIF